MINRADAIILCVAQFGNAEACTYLEQCLQQVQQLRAPNDIPILVAQCKCDEIYNTNNAMVPAAVKSGMYVQPQIAPGEWLAFYNKMTQEYKLPWIETSAKMNTNCTAVFEQVALQVVKHKYGIQNVVPQQNQQEEHTKQCSTQ